MSATIAVREARPADVGAIFAMVVALAEYERAPDQVVGTPGMLASALFGPAPAAEAIVAERDGEVVGFALFHGTFSTWECDAGIWLEDLFVYPEHRRDGVGELLLRRLARLAVQRGRARLEWAALHWNEPALSFYAKHGAEPLDEWRMHRLSGAALVALSDGG